MESIARFACAALLWGAPAGAFQLQAHAAGPEQCRTAAPGDECYREVQLVMAESIRHPALGAAATFEDVQAFLHGLQGHRGSCARPCPGVSGRRADAESDQVAGAAGAGRPGAQARLPSPEELRKLQLEDGGYEDTEGAVLEAAARGLPATDDFAELQRLMAAPEQEPTKAAPASPSGTGCFVWLPSGCETSPDWDASARLNWGRDAWGEASMLSTESAEACLARKRDFDALCGVADAVMLPLPPPRRAFRAASDDLPLLPPRRDAAPDEVQAVPLGEVVITHAGSFKDEYLYATQHNSNGGRFVHTWTMDSLQEDPQARWNISKVGGNYVITHAGSFKDEYLCASQSNDLLGGHFVHTWMKGWLRDTPQAQWNISKVGENYVITNARSSIDEYLSATQHSDSHGWRFVHTMMKGGSPVDDPEALWTIRPVAKEMIDFTITRDRRGNAGFQIRWYLLGVAGVDPDGPAYRAGMREGHVDWIITHVDGLEVTSENGRAALDATRGPDRTFTIRVKRPDKESLAAASPAAGAPGAEPGEGDVPPRSSGPAQPRSAGCFVWMPGGCRRHHFRAKRRWQRDLWGEANARAGQSADACQARKRAFDAWCGVTDAIMLWTPPEGAVAVAAPDPVLPFEDYVGEDYVEGYVVRGAAQGAEGEQDKLAAPKAKLGDTDDQLPEGAPALPEGTGCFVLLPNGCKSIYQFHTKFHWRRDIWGEENARAGESVDLCKARKREFDSFCGVKDAVMLPLLAAPEELPPADAPRDARR